MVLPNWADGIESQITTFLSWPTVSALVQIVVGIVVGTMVVNLFMKVANR